MCIVLTSDPRLLELIINIMFHNKLLKLSGSIQLSAFSVQAKLINKSTYILYCHRARTNMNFHNSVTVFSVWTSLNEPSQRGLGRQYLLNLSKIDTVISIQFYTTKFTIYAQRRRRLSNWGILLDKDIAADWSHLNTCWWIDWNYGRL